MNICEKNIKAAIFDLDGTLIDSTSIWYEIDREFFRKRGREVPKGYTADVVASGLENAAYLTRDKYGVNEDPDAILKEWNDAAKDYYCNVIELKPGAIEVLEYLKTNNVRIGLATANKKELYIPCLKRLGILDYFEIVVDVKKFPNGKRTPDIYHSVAEFFNVKPEETLVFEDIADCVRVAYEAGFITIGVYDINSAKDEEANRKNSYLYIHKFKDFIDAN